MHKYDIVDYISELGGALLVSDMDGTDENGDDDGDEEEGVDVSDNAFPDVLSDDDADNGGEYPSLMGMNLSAGSTDTSCQPCETEFQSSPTQELYESSVPLEGSTNLPAGDLQQSTSTSYVEAGRTQAIIHDHVPIAMEEKNESDDVVSCSLISTNVGVAANIRQTVNWLYSRAAEYSTFTVLEAWEHGNIACKQYFLGDNHQYSFLWPILSCEDYCHPHGCFGIQVGEDRYMDAITMSTNWYDGIFILSFAQLAAHYAHSTVGLPEPGMTYPDVLPQLIHVTYPRGK